MRLRRGDILKGVAVAGWAIVTLIGHPLLPQTLVESAITSWADNEIADRLGIRNPTLDEIERVAFTWVLPAFLVALILAAAWIVVRDAIEKRTRSRTKPLPSNAKFRYREGIFWATPRRYTKQEAGNVWEALREVYDCLNGKAAPIVANYDEPATLFTREGTATIQQEGPQSAIANLDAIRNQIGAVHTELQTILSRRPYLGADMRALINDTSETGEMNGALSTISMHSNVFQASQLPT